MGRGLAQKTRTITVTFHDDTGGVIASRSRRGSSQEKEETHGHRDGDR